MLSQQQRDIDLDEVQLDQPPAMAAPPAPSTDPASTPASALEKVDENEEEESPLVEGQMERIEEEVEIEDEGEKLLTVETRQSLL